MSCIYSENMTKKRYWFPILYPQKALRPRQRYTDFPTKLASRLHMSKILYFCLFILTLSSCATTPSDLRKPKNQYRVILDLPYQLVFKRINTGALECYQVPTFHIGGNNNHALLYPDLKEAEIVTGANGMLHSLVDIRSLGDNKTELSAYHAFNPEAHGRLKHNWALGNYICSVYDNAPAIDDE